MIGLGTIINVVAIIAGGIVGLLKAYCNVNEVISGIIADEISIGVANTKTTAVRVIPAYGKQPGDSVEFGGLLGHAPIIRLNPYSPAKFISRGGRIPAPIHSLKN